MAAPNEPDTSIIETLQSLLVAFVLAMTFRGFVTEGFVIPTGSMAPTLMGRHFMWRSDETGYRFPLDVKGVEEELQRRPTTVFDVHDPMLGPEYTLANATASQFPRLRMGDRILVIKCLYPFREPDRFDVVVFKNPTNPTGEDENYIKRLVGLPGESIWLLDGDVFTAPAAAPEDYGAYEIQRKPLHVQRAVWQPVYDSDYVPINPQRLHDQLGHPYREPWSGENWTIDGDRTYRCDSAGSSVLRYDTSIIPIDDRMTYNMLSYRLQRPRRFKVSDVRVSAAIVPDAEGLETTLELITRGSRFAFTLAGDTAEMSIRPINGAEGDVVARTAEIDPLKPGRVTNVEFWHVDQSMRIFIDGDQVGEPLEYDWKPLERIDRTFERPFREWKRVFDQSTRDDPVLRWYFSGSPISLHRVRLDRDLYYRPGTIQNNQKNRPYFQRDDAAFGTSPDHLAVLSPDQYFMLGDNSPQSSDSRLWGSPHPLVSHLIDEAPFVVNRKLMLGKAWVVYFPAPYGLGSSHRGVIPDFGRLRFIR